ncbi:MAG: VOC family protein [Firmicutes bacterium]|nr:VOC family protein [Bacillota bacterium]
MLKKIEHVGIMVKDLDVSIDFYTNVLGLKLKERITTADGNMKIAFITIGESELELLCPKHGDVPGSQGVIAHLAFTVDDIEKVVDSLRGKAELIDETPREALDGCKIFFFKGPDGEILELFQPRS